MPIRYPAIMIVAHPDDETIFGGVFLACHPGSLVLCMTRGGDVERRPEFDNAMKALRAEYKMFDFEDIAETPLPAVLVHEQIRPYMRHTPLVVTHAKDGEYGHPHHKQLHGIVRSFSDNIWCFTKGTKLDQPYIEMKRRILGFYKTQTAAVDSLTEWIEYEQIVHVLDKKRVIKYPPVTE